MVKSKILEISLCGGSLPLDFVNTVNEWIPSKGVEYLVDYHDFQLWTNKLKVLKPAEYKRYSSYLTENPINENSSISFIREVRDGLLQCFHEIASAGSLTNSALEIFNRHMQRTNSALVYHKQKDGSIDYAFADKRMEYVPLWYVLKEAEMLILDHSVWSRIRECPSCGWLFLDTSKGGKRKWCDMAVCGSRDKALRYYRRIGNK